MIASGVEGSGGSDMGSGGGAVPPVVLWLVAEAFPWVHTGGLGDVAGSLPRVLRQHGWDVRLCLPLHRSARRHPIGPPLVSFDVLAGGGRRLPCALRPAIDPPGGVPVTFVDSELFDRAGVYGEGGTGYADNAFRFGVWQLAARKLAALLDPAPVLIHCHDWHASLMPALAKLPALEPDAETASAAAAPAGVRRSARTILTIHNLEFQGVAHRSALDHLGLPPEAWHPEWFEHFGAVNFLKGGILSADLVSTVSRTYAVEIRTPEGGRGLDGPLRDRGADLVGIVNGIDVVAFDPATDPALPAHFDADHRAGRARVKAALRDEVLLPGGAGDPLLAFVGRLTETKGVDLLIDALPDLLALGAKLVVLGSGDPALEARLADAERAYPGSVRALARFDPDLARRIYGGADLLLVPSRAEPCGLVQLYALRYGAVPVVHAVGGLQDTVSDGHTGFKFHRAAPAALVEAVARALEVYSQPERWAALVDAGMREDWSWQASAAGYDALYRRVLAAPPRVRPPPVPEDDQPLLVDWGEDLPVRLGMARLALMVQGADCLYGYWEAPEGDLELTLEEQPTGLAFLLVAGCADTGNTWIPALPEHAYRATLQRRDGTIVLRSNLVLTPRAAEAPPRDAPAGLPADGAAADEPAAPSAVQLLLAAFDGSGDRSDAEVATLFPALPRFVIGRRQWDGRISAAPLPVGPPPPGRGRRPGAAAVGVRGAAARGDDDDDDAAAAAAAAAVGAAAASAGVGAGADPVGGEASPTGGWLPSSYRGRPW